MAPPNTSCASATVIAALRYVIVVDPTGATESQPGSPCGDGSGQTYGDLWWAWTAPAGVTQIGVYTYAGSAVTVFSGSCGSLTTFGCTNFGMGGGELLVPVTTGVTYYFRVFSPAPTLPASYTMIVRDASFLLNDSCATAAVVGSVPYSNLENTADAPAGEVPDGPCGTGSSYRAVWYTYTVGSGITRLAVGISDAANVGVVNAFSGACGSLLNLGCTKSGSGEVFIPVTSGDTYYFMVTSLVSTGVDGTFTLRDATQPPPSPTTACVEVNCGPAKRWELERFDMTVRIEERR